MDEIYEGMRREQPDTLIFSEWMNQRKGDPKTLSHAELSDAFYDSAKYGPSNGWAGIGGTLSMHIRSLLEHIVALEKQIAAEESTIEIDDEPLSIFAGEREPTLSESLQWIEYVDGNVVMRGFQ